MRSGFGRQRIGAGSLLTGHAEARCLAIALPHSPLPPPPRLKHSPVKRLRVSPEQRSSSATPRSHSWRFIGFLNSARREVWRRWASPPKWLLLVKLRSSPSPFMELHLRPKSSKGDIWKRLAITMLLCNRVQLPPFPNFSFSMTDVTAYLNSVNRAVGINSSVIYGHFQPTFKSFIQQLTS